MKKKIVAALIVLCLCITSLLGLAGCGINLSMPTNLNVTGNGGAVVRVGEYLYFTNGFVKISNLNSGSNRGNITQGGLYRARVGTNGTVNYTENGSLEGLEKVVDEIVGFSSQNLFVYDEYIYYATPLNLKDQQGATQFGRTVLKRVKLSGQDAQELYTTTTNQPINWAVYKLNGSVVIGVLDNTDLISINVSNNKQKTTIANNVTSVVFPEVNEYNPNSNSESATKGESVVYYTRDKKDTENFLGTAIYSQSLLEKQEDDVICAGDGSTYEVKGYTTRANSGEVYYTKTLNGSTYYFGTKVLEDGTVDTGSVNSTRQYTTLTYEQVMFTNSLTGAVVSYKTTNSAGTEVTKIQIINNDKTEITVEQDNLTLITTHGEYAYAFNSNNQILKISVWDGSIQVIADFAKQKDEDDKDIEDGKGAFYADGFVTDKLNISLFVDFDGDYMYFYQTFYTSTEDGAENYVYLAKVNYKSSSSDVSLVGVMEEDHIYKVNEELSAEE